LIDKYIPLRNNTIMRNADPTRTACRNIPTAASQLDKARKMAREMDCVVGFVGASGAQLAFPSDSQTGSIWLVESLLDAEAEVVAKGWEFALLGMEEK
jgi:hypothetical protein